VHFDASKEKVLDIFEIVTKHFQLDTFHHLGVKLIASWPVSGDNQASKFLEEKYFKISEPSFAILGPGRDVSGMRFHFNQGNSLYDLRIEPQLQNLSRLWIELDIQYPTLFKGLKEIGPHMQIAYDYLFNEVRNFLESPV